MTTHTFPIRVYYEDTDAGGIVYYANYLKFAERARTELLRSANLESSTLRAQCGILIVVKTVEIDYKKPSVLDDSLTLTTTLVKLGGSSMTMTQNVTRGDDAICDMTIVLVCVSVETGRPVRWPDQVVKVFE